MADSPQLSPRSHMRIAPYLTLYVLLLLAACQSNAPDPSPHPTGIAATPRVTETSFTQRPTRTDTPATPEATPAARPTRAALNGPIYGGMVPPNEVEWYQNKSNDPLGYLLGQQLHASLLHPLTYAPWLATDWELTGNTATFTLSPTAQWSDGSPIRALDVADMLQQGVARGDLNGVGTIRADGTSVTVTLSGALCPTLTRVAAFPLVDAIDEFPPLRTSGVATIQSRSDTEWQIQSSQGESFRYRLFDDEQKLREAWAAGDLTGVIGASRLKLGILAGGQRQTLQQNNSTVAALIFRLQDATVQAPSIRTALSLAIDRNALFTEAYGGDATVLPDALLPPSHWAMPDLKIVSDTARAAQILEGAGYIDRNNDGIRENINSEPLRVTILTPLSPDEQWESVARTLAAQWRTVGVDAAIQYVESYALEERLHDGRWQIALLPYQLADDPDQRALWTPPVPTDLIGQDLNVTGYDNPAVTRALYKAALVPGCDLEARGILYSEAWERILTDIPVLPLFALPLDIVVR